MTSERKEIVVDVDGGNAEEMSPDLGERHFQLALNGPQRVAFAVWLELPRRHPLCRPVRETSARCAVPGGAYARSWSPGDR